MEELTKKKKKKTYGSRGGIQGMRRESGKA